jgi:hypothetical protein
MKVRYDKLSNRTVEFISELNAQHKDRLLHFIKIIDLEEDEKLKSLCNEIHDFIDECLNKIIEENNTHPGDEHG